MVTLYREFTKNDYFEVFKQIQAWCEKQKEDNQDKIIATISHNITAAGRGEGATYYGSCIISFQSPLL